MKKLMRTVAVAVFCLSAATSAIAAQTQQTTQTAPARAAAYEKAVANPSQKTQQQQSSVTSQPSTTQTQTQPVVTNPVPTDDPAEQEAAQKAQEAADAKAAAELAEKMKVNEPGAALFQVLERCEVIVYGQAQTGALLSRLVRLEKDVFGRELPGSLTERQTAMIRFLEQGTSTSPSLLYKVAIAEWGTMKKINPEQGLARRLDAVEIIIDGTTSAGPLASRTEKLLAKILPENTNFAQTTLPKGTVVKAQLLETLTVRTCKKGDKVNLGLLNEVKQDDIIVAPAGSRLLATITKVKAPRSFGRSSEIEMQFDALETIQPKLIPVGIGEFAKKAKEVDASTIGAVGASFAGAIILGPVGLVGGAFVRGNDKQLKQGTVFYVETAEAAEVNGYKIPTSINPYADTNDNQPSPQGSGALQPAQQ